MGKDQELEEFYEEFGEPPLSATALDTLLERARNTSDRELRFLVKEAQFMRWLIPHLLERIERTDKNGAGESDMILKMAQLYIRGIGRIGDA